MAAPVELIVAAAQIERGDLGRRVKALEDHGVVTLEEHEGTLFLVLVDPTARSIGWDLFEAIHGFAKGDRSVIEAVVDGLDFTILDA